MVMSWNFAHFKLFRLIYKEREIPMSLISITDVEITSGKNINLNGVVIREALRKLKDKNLIREEEYEKTVDIAELFLEMYKVVQKRDKRFKNKNARSR
jgi:hypothetical protein